MPSSSFFSFFAHHFTKIFTFHVYCCVKIESFLLLNSYFFSFILFFSLLLHHHRNQYSPHRSPFFSCLFVLYPPWYCIVTNIVIIIVIVHILVSSFSSSHLFFLPIIHFNSHMYCLSSLIFLLLTIERSYRFSYSLCNDPYRCSPRNRNRMLSIFFNINLISLPSFKLQETRVFPSNFVLFILYYNSTAIRTIGCRWDLSLKW